MRRLFQILKAWIWRKLPYVIVSTALFIIIVLYLWHRIFIVVGAGEGGVLYRPLTTGTVTDYVYPEGVHVLFPLNTMTIYDAKVQIIKHKFDVLTNRGLPITLSLAIRYRPIYELLGALHQHVGITYPQKIILPQVESVLRKRVGQYSPEEIFTNKEGILNEIISLAIREVGRKYVYVDEIIIRSLHLPEEVKAAIEKKLVHEQEFLSYKFRLQREKEEAERKRIEANGIMVYQRIISSTLDENLLRWQGIQATLDLAKSENSKVVVIGAGEKGLPIILGNQ